MKRNDFRVMIAHMFTAEECGYIMTAYDYSKYAHRNQEREIPGEGLVITDTRYFTHPKRLAVRMIKAGVRDWQVICMELLHDSVEDTALFGNQLIDGYDGAIADARFRISKAFNKTIAEDVISLTIPKENASSEQFSTKTKCLDFYKKKLEIASIRALLGKEFDRIDNLETVEVKGEHVAGLKIKETEDFYIPLFELHFSNPKDDLQKIGQKYLLYLKYLNQKKGDLIKYGFVIGKDGKTIEAGTTVSFRVENHSDWGGDTIGVLVKRDGQMKVQTSNSGLLTIDKGYDVDGRTIKKIA